MYELKETQPRGSRRKRRELEETEACLVALEEQREARRWGT
jgi:hypothetical protein